MPSDTSIPGWGATSLPQGDPASWPPVITRVHRGSAGNTSAAAAAESAYLAPHGYVVTSHGYDQGQWGCGAFLVALALCVLLIGLLVFLYLIIVKPDGTLTVTYQRVATAPQSQSPSRQVFTVGPPAR